VANSLTIIARAGKDSSGHALFRCQCSCGREVTLRRWQANNKASCGDCLPAAPVSQQAPAPVPQPTAIPDAPSTAVAGASTRTPEYLVAEIQARDAAILKLDEQIADLSRLLAAEGVLPTGLDGDSAAKLFREVVTTANVLRKEKQRLEKELRDLSGQKAVSLNSTESVLARVRKLRGKS
jgi:hypothetical protein